MNAITLSKKNFNGDGVVIGKCGHWVSNGHWALHERMVKNFAIFKDKATAAAALDIERVNEADIQCIADGASSKAASTRGRLEPFRRLHFLTDASNAGTLRVFQRSCDGCVTFVADRYTFGNETLYGVSADTALIDDPDNPSLVVMPARCKDSEALPFELATCLSPIATEAPDTKGQ